MTHTHTHSTHAPELPAQVMCSNVLVIALQLKPAPISDRLPQADSSWRFCSCANSAHLCCRSHRWQGRTAAAVWGRCTAPCPQPQSPGARADKQLSGSVG